MQLYLEHFAVAVAAITGVLAARGKSVDLFGVVVLAVVTAFGGGTVRDVALGDFPVVFVRHEAFLVNALVVAFISFFFARYYQFPQQVLMVADAFSLALFTIIGAKKAYLFGHGGTVIVAMGVITGVAGGILRDLLTGEIPLVFRPHIYLYATAAMAGAIVYLILLHLHWEDSLTMCLGTGTTLVLRLAGIRWKIGLPVFEPKEDKPAS